MLEHLYHVAEILGALAGAAVVTLPWTYRWIRNINLIAGFVKHAHDTELPHIHETLEEVVPQVLHKQYTRPVARIQINGQ